MPLGNPIPGQNLAAEFQISSIPWVTSSVLGAQEIRQLKFNNIAKSICVKNSTASGNNMRVAFTLNGLKGSNYFELIPGESFTADARIIDLFLSGSNVTFTTYADLTNLQRGVFVGQLTGSAGIDGVG